MSDFHVEVVRVGPLVKNENSDSLWMTKVRDYTVQVKTGEFKEGDLAVYIPVDSVVPADDPRWEFLKGHNRIKARRLRGVFSLGLLTKADPGWTEGQDVAEALRIIKYEPPEPMTMGGECEKCPFDFPKYTDLESRRRWPDLLQEGEEVVFTEKIHGTSSRYVWKEDRLWVGSHTQIKKESAENVYWKAAAQIGLAEILAKKPGIAFYGEVFGWVQDLHYGHSAGKVSVRFFDALDMATMKWMDFDPFMELCAWYMLPTVPVIYRGPWDVKLKALAEGKSTLAPEHIREGFVVKPVKERFDPRLPGQRAILKYHGEGYLLR
jgi:RNA ligase (TIGR02306 family)